VREPAATPRVLVLRSEALPQPFAWLVAAADTMPAAGPAAWLAVHSEPGQTLAEFRASSHRRPTSERRVIALCRLGRFTAQEERVLEHVPAYLEAFYTLPVRVEAPLPLEAIPAGARREGGRFGEQVLTTWVNDSLLASRMPADAHLFIALAACDLYPESGWNFVFGQARPSKGVGVWSIARFGDRRPAGSGERVLLARTLRTASHEVGHLLGLAHCVTYLCLMNGSNSLEEHDARPFELCPACMAKVCGDLGVDPVRRARALEAALRAAGLTEEAMHESGVASLLAGETE
jgi:archaemetzincin